jgi:hypothetical protein
MGVDIYERNEGDSVGTVVGFTRHNDGILPQPSSMTNMDAVTRYTHLLVRLSALLADSKPWSLTPPGLLQQITEPTCPPNGHKGEKLRN